MPEKENPKPPLRDEKAEESEKFKKSHEYRRFRQLLNQVIKAPPIQKSIQASASE